ncbi:MAG: fluoride efflux transporter CrcB [Bacteroidetes bacterium]|nr:fluoride efflux transporter CrcB [Bacteroidota bacterium]
MLKHYLLVFAGGGIGASARYWLSGIVYRFLPASFPYGNLIVNITGCFAIGFITALLDERYVSEPALRIFLMVGILGGFTTFSSFSYETAALLRDAEILLASINIAASVFGCLAATFIGILIGRLV